MSDFKKKRVYDWYKDFEKRGALLGWLISFGLIVLILRLWFLQVVSGDYYQKLAEQNRLKIEKIPALRGKIYDAGGTELAKNRLSLAVFVDKSRVNDTDLFERISKILRVDKEELVRTAKKGSFRVGNLILIEKDIPYEKAAYLLEHKEEFEGVSIDYIPVRYYPKKTLASHVIGYVGEVSEEELKTGAFADLSRGDIVGKTGVERAYEDVLRGEKGEIVYEVDALGNIRRVVSRNPAVSGKDIYLTIDAEVQKKAEDALVKAIQLARKKGAKKANAGAAVVLEVNTGRVVALASYPAYDPNLFVTGIDPKLWAGLNSPKSGYPLLNRATKAAYPPGSTFKPLTLISAFENRRIYLGESFFCGGVWYGFGRSWPKSCWKRSGHGNIGLVESIVDSCDTVYYELGYRLYKTKGEPLQNTARKYGFGFKTGIEIGEIEGRVPDKEWKKKYFKKKENQIWLPGDTVNMAIGQGDLLATPLQVASFYAAIATGGKFYKPQLVEKVVTHDGRVIRQFTPELRNRVEIPSTALRIIRRGLEEVCERGTAGTAFSGFPVSVSGKTGTSQVFGKDDFAWFAAYAPSDKPRYVVCVMIEEGGHGGEVAAPAVRFILSEIFGVSEEELISATDVSR
jgi:penicillin-binding protein 2